LVHAQLLVKAVPVELQKAFLVSLLRTLEQSFANCIIPTSFLIALLRHHEVRNVEQLEHPVQQLEFSLNTNRITTVSILHGLRNSLPNGNQPPHVLLMANTASNVWRDLRATDRKRKLSSKNRSTSMPRRNILFSSKRDPKPAIESNHNQSIRFQDLLG
jgi:hypothetical protein